MALSLTNNADEIIIIGVVTTSIVSIVEKYAGVKTITESVASILIGGFLAGSFLLLLAYVAPPLASGLALIMVVTTILVKGTPFWKVISGITSAPTTTATAATAATASTGGATAVGNSAGQGTANTIGNTGSQTGQTATGAVGGILGGF